MQRLAHELSEPYNKYASKEFLMELTRSQTIETRHDLMSYYHYQQFHLVFVSTAFKTFL